MINRFPRLIAFAAGAIAATGFAPLNLWPLMFIGLVLLIALVKCAPSWKATSARGWFWGWGHFIVCSNWIAHAFTFQDNMPHWLGWIAVVGLGAYLALFVGLCAGVSWFARAKPLPFTLIFTACWIVVEMLRARLFSGYAWDPIGVMWANVDYYAPTRWLAPWLGTYAMSGLTVIIAGLFLVKSRVTHIMLALWVLSFGYSLVGHSSPRKTTGQHEPLLTIVQPNIPEQAFHDPSTDFANFIKLMRTSGTPAPAHPRLILWPEGSLSDDIEHDDYARQQLAIILAPKDILVAGGDSLIYKTRKTREGGTTSRLVAAANTTFALDAKARIIGRYDKAHLVPGGEYLPLRSILSRIGLNRLVPGDLDFIPGPGPRTIPIPGFGKMGNVICYEIIFSGEVTDRAHRPDFIFNPSNDAWFGAWGPPQHLAQAQMRALEEGVPIIRSTPTGISAVIDAEGRILQSLPLGAQSAITAAIPNALPLTFFAQFGNLIPLIIAFITAAIGIALSLRKR